MHWLRAAHFLLGPSLVRSIIIFVALCLLCLPAVGEDLLPTPEPASPREDTARRKIPLEKYYPPIPPPGCRYQDDAVYFPITSHPLKAPQKGYEAFNSPAFGGYNVLLHDKSLLFQVPAAELRSVGISFLLMLTYRSAVATEAGGTVGHGWHQSYDVGVLPLGGDFIPNTGLKRETAPFGDLEYRDGTGRIDILRFQHAEIRRVKNFHENFRAHVTYYRDDAGRFLRFYRVAVLPGYNVPFSNHRNFEGRLFYFGLDQHGNMEVFSCRGQLLHRIDVNENIETIEYREEPLNPLTQNPNIEKVIDTANREHVFEHRRISQASVDTYYRGVHETGPRPIMRLAAVVDSEGRRTELQLDVDLQLSEIRKFRDGHPYTTAITYARGHKLETYTLPGEPHSFLKNVYDNDEVTEQHLGDPTLPEDPLRGYEGGIIRFEGDTIIGLDGSRRTYGLKVVNGYTVIETLEEQTERGTATTRYEYNRWNQLAVIHHPNGNVTEYVHEENEIAISPPIGDVVNWVERNMTYEHAGQQGLLRFIRHKKGTVQDELAQHFPDAQHPDMIEIEIRYEPRFNAVKEVIGPEGWHETREYDHGWYDRPGDNANFKARTFALASAPGGSIRHTYSYTRQGLLETETDSENETLHLRYTHEGYLWLKVSPRGGEFYLTDGRGNVTLYVDDRGVLHEYEYNERDLLERMVTDVGGFENTTILHHDLAGNLHEVEQEVKRNVDPRVSGKVLAHTNPEIRWVKTTFEHNLLRNPISKTVAGSKSYTEHYAYDLGQRMTKVTFPDSSTASIAYTKRGAVKNKSQGGLGVSYEYDDNGNLVLEKDGEGNETKTVYDGFDRPYKVIFPNGSEVLTRYSDADFAVETKTFGENHAGRRVLLTHRSRTRDEFGRLTNSVDFVLDSSGAQVSEKETTYTLDTVGRVVMVDEGSRGKTEYKYENGRRKRAIDSLGNISVYEWDGYLLASVTTHDKGKRFMVHAASFEPQPADNSVSYETAMVYDSMGRLIELKDAAGQLRSFAYDSLGHLIVEHAPGGVVNTFEFDEIGMASREVFAKLSANSRTERSFERDSKNRVKIETVKRGGTTTSKTYTYYDSDLVNTASIGSNTYTYRYDGNGSPVYEKYPNGIEVTRDYGPMGALEKVSVVYADSTEQAGSREDSYRHDGLGRITEAVRNYLGVTITNLLEHNSLGLVTAETQDINGYALRVGYEYDEQGLKKKTVYPALPQIGALVLEFKHDDLGRVASIESGREILASYDYYDRERVSHQKTESVIHEIFGFDAGGRAKDLDVFAATGGGIVLQGHLMYGGVGGRVSQQTLRWPAEERIEIKQLAYLPAGAIESVRATDFQTGPAPNERVLETKVRRNHFEAGELSHSVDYFTRWRQYPGVLFGTNEETTEEIARLDYQYQPGTGLVSELASTVYEADDVWGQIGSLWLAALVSPAVAVFLLHTAQDNPAPPLPWSEIERVADGQSGENPIHRATLQVTRDECGNIVGQRRFTYKVDYRDQITEAVDEFDTLRGTRERMRYYYDYLGRPVLLVWEPENRDVEAIHEHRRFLYDGQSLLAELSSDRRGQVQETRGRYINHPEGDQIVEMELKDPTSGGFETLIPNFGFGGELASVIDDVGAYRRVVTVFDALPRLYSRLVRRLESGQVEIPLLAQGYLLDPFTANPLHYGQNGVIPDINRDFDKEWNGLVQHSADRFAELNHQLHRKVMHFMGWSFLPAVVFEPWILLGAAFDVLVEFGLSLAFDWDYRFDDAMLTFKYGIPFAGFAVEARALGKGIEEAIQASIRAASRRSAANLARNLPEEELVRLLREMPGFPDEPARSWWDPPGLVHNLPDEFPQSTIGRFPFPRWGRYRVAVRELGIDHSLVRYVANPQDADILNVAAVAVRRPGAPPYILLYEGTFDFDRFLHSLFGNPTVRMVLAHEVGHLDQPWRLYRMASRGPDVASAARRRVEWLMGEASASLFGAHFLLMRGHLDDAIRLWHHSVGSFLDEAEQLLPTVSTQSSRGVLRANIYARDIIRLRSESDSFWWLVNQAQ